ncbi:hypothetical protein HanXRQr2_Chr02g0048971 [Helianthus annuus]|uniref:Uncharacterized protein n=1 Tax=Helianthus annuus TaxID=4232 RepID=A0A251VDR8_HELAN|nr:hypothetical protein HanXRQr2_Chr02g0048971 [Helianthus annuus]KAJ0950450.1 hypothetical protein HanPSC8_Chr02g0048401 [Helianthus annuus]
MKKTTTLTPKSPILHPHPEPYFPGLSQTDLEGNIFKSTSDDGRSREDRLCVSSRRGATFSFASMLKS